MSRLAADPRARAAAVALLLFGLGVVAGVAGDRAWLTPAPRPAAATPLTMPGLARALDLDAVQQARVTAVFDTLRPAIARAVLQGGDSLQRAARWAQERLQAALPPERRDQFQDWMSEHHRQMMQHMGPGGGMMGGNPRRRMMP